MNQTTLSIGRMISSSLRFHWRSALAVALGVAAATAVITGALLVGDSMRGSLRSLTQERLGSIDFMLVPGTFFDASLADRLQSAAREGSPGIASAHAAPLMIFTEAVVETADGSSLRRAGAVQVVGCDDRFWQFDTARATAKTSSEKSRIDESSVILNATAANQLGVKVGELVTVRLPTEQAVPADNPLGRRDAGTAGIPRLKVVEILPEHGLGRFSLRPSQQATSTAFISLSLVQDTLERPEKANALLLATGHTQASDPKIARQWAEQWSEQLPLTLSDYGLRLQHVEREFKGSKDVDAKPEKIFDYWSLTSERLILADPVTEAMMEHFSTDRAQPVMTYLANAMVPDSLKNGKGEGNEVAYSMITGILDGPGMALIEETDNFSTEAAGLFLGAEGNDERVPVVLNRWAADRMQVKPGDAFRIDYFAPETVGGSEVKQSLDAVVAGIVPLTKPAKPYSRVSEATFDEPPTRFNDPDLTPTVPGVTDQDSILDWDLPFELEKGKISKEDDAYWNDYRLTPKAFLPYEVAREKFGSRFGHATSIMIQSPDESMQEPARVLEEDIVATLDEVRSHLGWVIQPVKALQLTASRGSTPFDILFLSLSFFVIVAALLLVILLLRLAVEQRSSEYGMLLSTGWNGPRVASLAIREYSVVVGFGSLIGIVMGAIYAAIVLYLLRTWWVGAVATPFLQLYMTPQAFLGGFLGGLLIGGITVIWTLRRLSRLAPRSLLTGSLGSVSFGGETSATKATSQNNAALIAFFGILGGIGIGIYAIRLQGQAQAGAFVGSGMLLLIGLLAAYRLWLGRRVAAEAIGFSVWQLSLRNGRRQPLRSVLTASLIAVAGFLVLAMGAFRLDPTESGTGGFDLMATTAQPISRDLNDPAVREDALGRDAEEIKGMEVLMVREKIGQDASCNNLYQATQPRVFGLPDRIAWFQRNAGDNAFAWAAGDPTTVWEDLAKSASGSELDPVPVILDQNTAMWSLQMYGGIGEVRSFAYDGGAPLYFRVVGLLGNSMMQGSLIVSEANFVRLFPSINGYRQMLIRSGTTDPDRVAEVLENRLGDAGVDVQSTRLLLGRLLEVQNTYLRTFQGLGALGLLLGTCGLAAAQLRSVMERRGEFALLRAVGFTRATISRLVLLEAAQLLCGGLLVAVVAAAAALVPYAWIGRAHVGWHEPAVLLIVVLIVGLLVSGWAARRALALELMPALRGK